MLLFPCRESEASTSDLNTADASSSVDIQTSSVEANIPSSTETASLPEIGYKPHQPQIAFPKRTFGLKNPVTRSFQSEWFRKWGWIHYDEENDSAFCYICSTAYKDKKLSSQAIDQSFICRGYTNWKDGCRKRGGFHAHELSDSHKEALERSIKPSLDVGEELSSIHKQEKITNRKNFLKIVSCLRFLCRQGLALRGHDEGESNVVQLCQLLADDDPQFASWLQKKRNNYASPIIQNEILRIFGNDLLREIASNIRSSEFFGILADECTDLSNLEQLVTCIRWVDDDLEAHEDYIGLVDIPCANAETITHTLKDILMRLGLPIEKARSQCYDGCSTMSGEKSGVAKRIKDDEPRCLYSHCYGHALSLACADSIKNNKLMKDALEITHEITKLIKKSPKRDAHLTKIKSGMTEDDRTANIRILCPTRWTVRANALKSIIDNYPQLRELWEWSLDNTSDTEMKARIRGVDTYMSRFDFYFGLHLGHFLLRHADNLSATLQTRKLSAAEGQSVAAMTINTLKGLRTEREFALFWSLVTKRAADNDVDEPRLPRRRKAPRRFEEGSADPTYPETSEAYYRPIYFEALDFIVSAITDRFDQRDYRIYAKSEQLLLKASNGDDFTDELEVVSQFYGADFEPDTLKMQLTTLQFNVPKDSSSSLSDIVSYLRSLSHVQKDLIGQVMKLAKLILVMPATNATSERSFSALRRVKTYLRTTMSQNRLNHLMMVYTHKYQAGELDMLDIANEFVSGNEQHRLEVFGRFVRSDLSRTLVSMKDVKTQTNP